MKSSAQSGRRGPLATVRRRPNAVTLAVGQNIKRFREAADITQEELAHEAEMERSRISKMENGRTNASLLTLATLCHCLGITLPKLFEGVMDTMPPVAAGGTPRRKNQPVVNKTDQKASRRSAGSKS